MPDENPDTTADLIAEAKVRSIGYVAGQIDEDEGPAIAGLVYRLTEALSAERAKIVAVLRLCDETDIETHEATQACLVGNIRAVFGGAVPEPAS
jgi:hypothetical protein